MKKKTRYKNLDDSNFTLTTSRDGDSSRHRVDFRHETSELTRTFYGRDMPKIFENIDFINTLLEGGTNPWVEQVACRFNTEI